MPHIIKALTSSVSSFRGMIPGEKTVLVTRRHWFFLFFSLLGISDFSFFTSFALLLYFPLYLVSFYFRPLLVFGKRLCFGYVDCLFL